MVAGPFPFPRDCRPALSIEVMTLAILAAEEDKAEDKAEAYSKLVHTLRAVPFFGRLGA